MSIYSILSLCPYCNEEKENAQDLKEHILELHSNLLKKNNILDTFYLDEADIALNNNDTIRLNNNYNNSIKFLVMTREKKKNMIFSCPYCKEKLIFLRGDYTEINFRKRVRQHMENHIESSLFYYICPFCDDYFSNQILFEKHFAENHSETEAFECSFCEKIFPDKILLFNHINEIHSNE